MSKAMIDRGLIAVEANSRAAQPIDLLGQQSLESQLDWFLCQLSLATQNRTAIHVQNLTVDMPRPFGAKENDGPADVVGRSDATNRNRIFQSFAKALTGECISAHIRIYPSRCD